MLTPLLVHAFYPESLACHCINNVVLLNKWTQSTRTTFSVVSADALGVALLSTATDASRINTLMPLAPVSAWRFSKE
jgi:hypothetical protein